MEASHSVVRWTCALYMRGHGRRRALPRVGIVMTRRHDDDYKEDGEEASPSHLAGQSGSASLSHSCFHSCCRLPGRSSLSLPVDLPAFHLSASSHSGLTALSPFALHHTPTGLRQGPGPANRPAGSLIYAKASKSRPPKRHCPSPEAEGYASLREHS